MFRAQLAAPFRSIDIDTGAGFGNVLLAQVNLFGQPFHAMAVQVETDVEQRAVNDPWERLEGIYRGDAPSEAYETIEGSELGGDAIPDAEYVVWLVPHS